MEKPKIKYGTKISKPVIKQFEPETQIASPASGIVKQPTMAQLQQQRQRAQVDMDMDAVNRIDAQMKAVRAAEGKQTFGDRLSDVFSGATSASGGNLVNAVGTVVNAYQDADSNRRQAQRLRDSIAKGYTTDGKPISEAMRKTMEESIAKLEADAAKWEQENSAANRLYKTADTLQETSREQVASAKEGLGAVGQFAVDAGVGAAQLAGDIAANVILPGAGTAMLAARSFGGAAQEARQSGADIGKQLGYGIGSAAASVLTEKLTNLAGPFKQAFGGGVLDDVLAKVSSKPAGKLIVSALSEGGEEMLESAMQPVLQRLTYDPAAAYDSEWLAETLYSGAVGAVLGGLGGGVDVITNPQSNAQESRAEVKDPNWQATLQTIAPEKREAFTQAKVIAERFGTPLNIAGIANGAAGEYLNGAITIDPNAANPARQVLIHELTHHMETSGLYREFSNMVMAKVNEMGVDVAAMRNDIIDSYAKNGVQIDELGADREIVAKFAEGMLFKDEKSVQRLLETDRNLFQRIYDWIRDAVRKLGKNPEQRFLIDAQNLYEKALRKAGQQAGDGVAQYTFEGYDPETGKGVYEGNFPPNTPKAQKTERILDYIQNVWSKKPIDLVVENDDGTTSVIQAQFDPYYDETKSVASDASKLMGGNRQGNARERRVTLDLADDYYQIASDAKYNYSKQETGKDSFSHNDVKEWHYFVNEILYKENGETKTAPYAVTINVKERDDGSFVYSFSAEDQEKFDAEQQRRPRTRRTLHAAVNQFGNTEKANAQPSNTRITYPQNGVKDPFDIVPRLFDKEYSVGPSFRQLVRTQKGDPFDIVPKLNEILGETNEAGEAGLTPETLPTRARDKLQQAERTLVNQIGNALSVPYTAKRDYLQGIVREMSTEYLATGKVSRETMDRLFETAYEQGIVVDTEYYDQYKELKDELRTRPVAISDADKADIADYNDFRKSTMGTLLISNSGTPVDILYGEFSERYPALFPRDIYAPSDQLQRLFEVGKGIRKVEHTLDSYYGEHAATFKAFAKRQFEDAATNAIRDFKEVRRWTAEQIEKRARQMAYTPDMLKNAHANIRRARKAREKALSQELLTDSDKALLKRLEAGEITVDDLKPGRDNVRGIRKVYEASQEYNQWNRVIKEYKKELNQKRRAEADAELGTMIGWKDKSAGWMYSRETMERNLRDIAPDKETADRIYNKYFKPVKDSNAAANRAKNDFRNRVRKLNLNRKPTNGNKVSEAYAVQFIGEAEDNIRMLEESTERNAKRDGMTLQEWKTEVQNFWRENPNLDKAKINESVQEFRSIYDELFQKMNEVRVRNGYEPVAYRKGYFPHFQEGESGLLTNFAQALGITADVTNLPTSINGLTHTFRPGITWFGHAQERKGFKTDYDAVKGFDKYIEGAADVIYQTDNIQNLRALAHQIRYNTTDDGIKAQVDNVRANENLNEDQKYNEIEKIYEDGQFALSNFVVELEEYTNLLANKKSRADRNMESLIGRKAYNVVKGLERRVAANMVAINPSSWLTNFIPITQGMASLDTRSLLQGMWDTLKAYKEPDGMVEVSSFLTNRRGSDPIAKTWAQEASAVLSKPMEWIDSFTADTLVRARYNQNVKNGMSEVDALNEADKWAAGVMADRSKGSMPTVFERSNPLTKLFTQFQLEVNNQYSFMFKDLPDDLKKKGAAAMTAALLKMFVGAWLYNEVYEYFIGRRPALDPLGILNDTAGDFTGYELPNMVDLAGEAISGNLGAEDFQTEKTGTYEAITNAGGQIVEQLPFIGGLAGGGRLPISSALPNVENLGKVLFSDDWAPEKKLATIGKELSAPLFYIAPPAGGGMLKKWTQNIKAAKEGGSYSINSKGEKLLQYPVYTETGGDIAQNVLTMGLFGKSALPQAQDWVESGFDSLGAKETQVYQGLTETGVGQREAFQFLQDFDKVEKTETESAATRKRRVLKDSDLSDEAKSMVFYGLLASDTEQETLDRMAEADFAGAAAAIMNLKDADLLKGTTATKAKRAAIMNASVSDRAKMVLYTEYVSDSKQDEIETVLDAGLTFDDWLTFEYRTAGLGSDQSKTKKEKVMDVIQNMNITPEQKDALYLTGYEASGLKDAPWHKGLTVPQIGATIFERPKLELPELKIPKLW